MVSVLGQPVVRLANAAAHAGQEGLAESRDVGHRLELARPDDEHVEVGRGRHRGRARNRLDRRQLAEVPPGLDHVHHPPGAGHRCRALQDDEELTSEASFAQDHLTGFDPEPLRQARHVGQLLVGAHGEPGHGLEQTGPDRRLTIGVNRHPSLPR